MDLVDSDEDKGYMLLLELHVFCCCWRWWQSEGASRSIVVQVSPLPILPSVEIELVLGGHSIVKGSILDLQTVFESDSMQT